MTYATVARIQGDPDLRERVAACVAVERISIYPEQWVTENAWPLASQPGWATAWESALIGAEEGYHPGGDESVITDGMILSAVQALAAPAAE